MASRVKEEEKNERIIRGLLKLEPNRRCINCNSLGPQYVCTNFWTFVCTNCSGIHREFTHRVKSISMAKFTSQEVSALQEGGNQCAKEVYLKEWDAQRHSFPDSSNVDRLRDFIKHVYVDRRFSGERAFDKPPSGKPADKDDSYESKRETYQGGAKSPPYEDTYERHFSDKSSPGGRSPGYYQENRQYGDYKRSPGRPPIINDWRREDRRISDGEYKVQSQSPERSTVLGSSSPPVVRPVREILGENVVPLRISEPPKPNTGRAADGSALTQRTASPSSLGSSNGNQTDAKLQTTMSLIDFDADPEPPVAAAIPQTMQTTVPQPVVQPENPNADNWASFDVVPDVKATPSPMNVNPLDSVLSQLSMPAYEVQGGPHVATAIPGGNVTTLMRMGGSSVSPAVAVPTPTLASASGAASVSHLSAFPTSGAAGPSSGLGTGHWASLQNQQSFFPANVSQSTQRFAPPVGGAANNQQWNIPSVPTAQGNPSTSMPHAHYHASNPANEVTSSVVSQPSSVEVKSTGRKELPEDLFTLKYPSYSAPVPGWKMDHPHGMSHPHGMGFPHSMGVNMQYNNVMPAPSFLLPSKSVNPFDVGSQSIRMQAGTTHDSFPSVSPLHFGLPNIPHSGGYMGQQMPPTSVHIARPEAGSFGTGGAVFHLSNQDQQLIGGLSNATNPNLFPAGGMGQTSGSSSSSNTPNPNPFPSGGNPFG